MSRICGDLTIVADGTCTRKLGSLHHAASVKVAARDTREKFEYGSAVARTRIAAGEDVNATDNDGATALICRVPSSRTDIAMVLARARADVHIRVADGTTAMCAREKVMAQQADEVHSRLLGSSDPWRCEAGAIVCDDRGGATGRS